MNHHAGWLVLAIVMLLAGSGRFALHAQVIRDGTVGPDPTVQPIGPSFEITEAMGSARGENLFHSFSLFNLDPSQSATFLAGDSITNIISRVTGTSPSFIDGTLISPVNLFFINPYGLMFGPNASVDVSGSFYATTADYVEFADGHRFEASPSRSTLLSTAPPRSFGFLSTTPGGPIVVEGLLLTHGGLGLVGGPALNATNFTSGDAGHIAVASAGTLTITGGSSIELGLFGIGDGGSMTLTSLGNLTVSGGSLIIAATEVGAVGAAGSVTLTSAGSLTVSEESVVLADHLGTGPGGNVTLVSSGSLTVSESGVGASHGGSGNAGSVTLTSSGSMTISGNNSRVLSFHAGSGDGGNVTLESLDSLTILGSFISAGIAGPFEGQIRIAGTGGSVVLSAPDVTVSDAEVRSSNLGDGPAGQVTVIAERFRLERSVVETTAATGSGGEIVLNVDEVLEVIDSVLSTSVAGGVGGGGDILITMTEDGQATSHMLLERSRLQANARGGAGGGIDILTDLFIASADPETAVTATSDVNLPGEIQISAPIAR